MHVFRSQNFYLKISKMCLEKNANYLCNKIALLYLTENKAIKPTKAKHTVCGTLGHHPLLRTCPKAPVCGHTHSLAFELPCHTEQPWKKPLCYSMATGLREQQLHVDAPVKFKLQNSLPCPTYTSPTPARPHGTWLWLCCLPAKNHPCAGQPRVPSAVHEKGSPKHHRMSQRGRPIPS